MVYSCVNLFNNEVVRGTFTSPPFSTYAYRYSEAVMALDMYAIGFQLSST